jgi:hypothetical protein
MINIVPTFCAFFFIHFVSKDLLRERNGRDDYVNFASR